MAYLSKLVEEFESRTNWSTPDPAVVSEFKEALKPRIAHEFDLDSYLSAGEFLRKILPSLFRVHGTDWSHVLDGKERVEDYLGKPGAKLVFIPGPHNSHLDEAVLGLSFYDSGVGDLRVGARTNMFIGPGKKLRKLGSWAMSFYERMPRKMRFAANDTVFEYLAETLIPEANYASEDGESGRVAAHPVLFMHDGRSYDGNLKPRKEGNIERLLKIQEFTDDTIFVVPVTETILFSPEQDAFPKLLSMDKTKTAKYLLTDYGNLFSAMARHYFLHNLKDIPTSKVYVEIHDPINLKELIHPDWYRWDIKRKKKHLSEMIEKEIVMNYRVMPEKILALALSQDESFLKGQPARVTDYLAAVADIREHLKRKKARTELLPEHPREIIDDALPYYIKSGAVKYSNGNIRAKKPFKIEYQANTIKHLLG